MKKVLVTGNSGYIGSHLCDYIKEGYKVYGLDIKEPTVEVNQFELFDINNTANWPYQNLEFDCVIHLASKVSVSPSVTSPIKYYQTNINGTLNVLKNIKTKRFVYASSGSAAGISNPYGISKRAAEDVVQEYCERNLIPFTITRFHNVIGTTGFNIRQDSLLASLLVAKQVKKFCLYGTDYNTADGSCVRDYTHVREVCISVSKLIETSTFAIEEFGHGKDTSVLQLINTFKKANQCDFEVINCGRRIGDMERSVAKNPSKHFVQLYTLEEMVAWDH